MQFWGFSTCKKQLNELQKRREQIELLMDWKKSLKTFKNDKINLLIDYINSKLKDYSVSEHGKKEIDKLSQSFEFADILDAIEISENKYLRYDSNND